MLAATGDKALRRDTLKQLLSQRVATDQADPGLDRRLTVACHLYNTWTERGVCPAALAERYFDGSLEALTDFVSLEELPRSTAVRKQANDSQTGSSCPGGQLKHSSASRSNPRATAVAATPTQSTPASAADSHHDTCGSPAQQQDTAVPRHHTRDLSYDAFVRLYMAPNRPVILQGLTQGWRACKDWVTSDGTVDMAFLQQHFGDAVIWATDTTRQSAGYGGGYRQRLTVTEYAAWWEGNKKGGQPDDLLYLKDWHFADEFASYKAYQLPNYFHEDWLNDWFDHRRCQVASSSNDESAVQLDGDEAVFQPDGDGRAVQKGIECSDYRFVYLGPKGSCTPLHADVLRSYSWSTNVCGRKLWRMLHPRHTHLLYDCFRRELAPTFHRDADSAARFPNLSLAQEYMVECVQEAGETIFVPSGWHHCVENLEDTLSINHNWLNGHNLHWALALLQGERADAVAAIEDCRANCSPGEFEGLVQRNLAASCSLSYSDFAAFITFMVYRAVRELDACKSAEEHGKSDVGGPETCEQPQQAGSASDRAHLVTERIQAGDGRQRQVSRACFCHTTDGEDGDGAVLAGKETPGSLGVAMKQGLAARSTEALKHCLSLHRLWLVGSNLLAEMTVLAAECGHTQATPPCECKASASVAVADADESSPAPRIRHLWDQEQLADFAQALMAAQQAVRTVLQGSSDCLDICCPDSPEQDAIETR